MNTIELKKSKETQRQSDLFGTVISSYQENWYGGLWRTETSVRKRGEKTYIVLPSDYNGRLIYTQYRVISGEVPSAEGIAKQYQFDRDGNFSNREFLLNAAMMEME